MHEFSMALTYIADPGHGWLRVPLVDIATLGVETTISGCSFIDSRYAYLEEDADAAIYLAALRERTQAEPTIESAYQEHFSRNRPTFGAAQFTAAFWNRLRR